MNDWMPLANALVFPAVLVAIGLLAWWGRRRPKPGGIVADGPKDEPYKVHTREFDLVLRAEEVPQRLQDASDDVFRGHADLNGEVWKQRLADAERWAANHPAPHDLATRFDGRLQRAGISGRPDAAITLLIDQSGSMRGDPMVAVRNAVVAATDAMTQAGVRVEVLGFSTAGWRGGFAHKHWLGNGAPKRPGRLCALLHIIYKEHWEPEWRPASRDVMLHPDILRENIDGEALEWAASRLLAVEAGIRALVVISDGAPVDDATVMHNGSEYLVRHLRRVIARIEGEAALRLGGVGVGYDVSRYYRRCRNADLDTLPDTLLALSLELTAGLPDQPGRAEPAPS